MRFITYKEKDNKINLGYINENEKIVNLTKLQESYPFFSDIISFIKKGDQAINTLKKIINSETYQETVNKEDIIILAPIPKPMRNIYCVGLNYAEHHVEFSHEDANLPENPIIFSKTPNSVIGPERHIELHSKETQELDYEAELGVVIGSEGRDIPKNKALDYVFGYTVINDVTARDLQRKHKQWLIGKSLDSFCPMGPSLIHHSQIPNSENLNITAKVNNELRQSSNTKHMIFDISTIISTISKGHTLEAGDIIATGTCAGVGMGFNPPKYLKENDIVEIEIEKVGVLKNQVK